MTQESLATGATGILRGQRLPDPVFVTRPRLPPLEAFAGLLGGVWERRHLTNFGPLHERLEAELRARLGARQLHLTNNGMTGLMIALLALELPPGEILTTPFTFPATVHAIRLAGHVPVFCDLAADSYNLDPDAVEAQLTPSTVAILAVHTFGTACDTSRLAGIAAARGIALVYDAAHTFDARHEGSALATQGDLSILSFHATKLYSTVEGGAIVSSDPALGQRIHRMRDFGIVDEATVAGVGLNAKLSDVHAAFGLLALPGVEQEIAGRRRVAQAYEAGLAGVPGLRTLGRAADPDWNCAYFPVRIDAARFGMNRDRVHAELRQMNVNARRYFMPLCSRIPPYDRLPSAQPARLPNAVRVADEVLCLPLFGDLDLATATVIAGALRTLHEKADA